MIVKLRRKINGNRSRKFEVRNTKKGNPVGILFTLNLMQSTTFCVTFIELTYVIDKTHLQKNILCKLRTNIRSSSSFLQNKLPNASFVDSMAEREVGLV